MVYITGTVFKHGTHALHPDHHSPTTNPTYIAVTLTVTHGLQVPLFPNRAPETIVE